jgi:hypothetical protein
MQHTRDTKPAMYSVPESALVQTLSSSQHKKVSTKIKALSGGRTGMDKTAGDEEILCVQ